MSRSSTSWTSSLALLAFVWLAPPPAAAVTLGFEDLVPGTSYGFGDLFTTGGVPVDVEAFQSSGGVFLSNFAEVDTNQNSGGTGNDLEINNVILDFGVPVGTNSFSFLFGEFGGNLNLNINGDFRNFENFQDIDGLVIGGVTANVISGGFGNDQGSIEFSGGPIALFKLGGQELWIDDVMAIPEPIVLALLLSGLTGLATFGRRWPT